MSREIQPPQHTHPGPINSRGSDKDVVVDSVAITRSLPAPGPFWTFNREERNAVAILFGLLAQPGNLEVFAELLGWEPADLVDAEVCVEWTYLRDLWNHHSNRGDNVALRAAILDCLQPANRGRLETCSIGEFNAHFGAGRISSATTIQSPSTWSMSRFDATISDDAEFRRTCRFKWAFNVKPDLVAQTPSGHVLCIEAKWGSSEGRYPSGDTEKAIFRRRHLAPVSQTEVQRYLVNEVLGLTGQFAYLDHRQAVTQAGRSITWAELLPLLDHAGSPAFISEWCDQAVRFARTAARAIPGADRFG
jgi:hypothetical protein